MRHHRTGLIASMEDIDNALPVDDTEAAEVAATVADDSSEIQTQSDDIGVTVTEVEDAVQDGETLESIGEVAAEAVESGEGMDEKTAEVASIAIEGIRENLGFDTSFKVVRSLEAFGNSNTKMSATRLVVEGVAETLKQIWASVKAAALRVWDLLKQLFIKIFQSATGLVKHIEALRGRARKMPAGAEPKEKTLKITGLARAFSVKGKADVKTSQLIAKNTQDLARVAGEIGKMQEEAARRAMALARGKMESADIDKFIANAATSADTFLKEAASVTKFNGNLPATKGDKKTTKKTTYEYFGPFIDNTVLCVTTSDNEFMNKSIKRSTISFVGAKDEAAKEIQALELGEVQQILGDAAKLANSLADWKATQGFYEKISKETASLAETVMSAAGGVQKTTGSSSEQRQLLTELKTETMASISSMNSFGNRAPALHFRLISSMADWASASLRNLREKA